MVANIYNATSTNLGFMNGIKKKHHSFLWAMTSNKDF